MGRAAKVKIIFESAMTDFTEQLLCIKGHDTDLASRMLMKDIHTITREELREVIKCENKFEIDFTKIEQFADSQFREIKVEMIQG